MMPDPARLPDPHELDDMILTNVIRTFPPQSDHCRWLSLSQTALINVRALVMRGRSETADRVMEHYWRRWREASAGSAPC